MKVFNWKSTKEVPIEWHTEERKKRWTIERIFERASFWENRSNKSNRALQQTGIHWIDSMSKWLMISNTKTPDPIYCFDEKNWRFFGLQVFCRETNHCEQMAFHLADDSRLLTPESHSSESSWSKYAKHCQFQLFAFISLAKRTYVHSFCEYWVEIGDRRSATGGHHWFWFHSQTHFRICDLRLIRLNWITK